MQKRLYHGYSIKHTNGDSELTTYGQTLRPPNDRMGGPSIPSISALSASTPTSSFVSLSAACKIDSSVGSTFPPGKLDRPR